MARQREVKPIPSTQIAFGDIVIRAFSGPKERAHLVVKSSQKKFTIVDIKPVVAIGEYSYPQDWIRDKFGSRNEPIETYGKPVAILEEQGHFSLADSTLPVCDYVVPRDRIFSVFTTTNKKKRGSPDFQGWRSFGKNRGIWLRIDQLDINELLVGEDERLRKIAKRQMEESGLVV